MVKRVRLFFSFRSPYSYLAGPRIFALPDAYDIELEWHGVPPMVERGVPLSPAKMIYILTDAQRVARKLDMPFQFPSPDPLPHARALLRGAEYASDHGKVGPWVLAITRAIWGDQRDASEPALLRGVASATGLDEGGSLAAIEANAAYDERVEGNAKLLEEVGHWGVPTLEVDGNLFWGQDRIEYLEDYLTEHDCRRS